MHAKEKIKTKYGEMVYLDSKTKGENLIFLHGLCCAKEVFYRQFSELSNFYRIIIPDFLGHGESEHAKDKAAAYTVPGFAESIIELFEKLNLQNVYIFGWSLGGSITIELLEKYPHIKKCILHGYPPVSFQTRNFDEAYLKTEYTHLLWLKNWSEEDAFHYMTFGGLMPKNDEQHEHFKQILERVKQCDGELREILYSSFNNTVSVSPKECVEKHRDKVKLLMGENDHGFQQEYFKKYFPDITIFLKNSGHASFWDDPTFVNEMIVESFSKG